MGYAWGKICNNEVVNNNEMAHVKRKVTFVEVKFDEGGNVIPLKRPRLQIERKNDVNTDAKCEIRSVTTSENLVNRCLDADCPETFRRNTFNCREKQPADNKVIDLC